MLFLSHISIMSVFAIFSLLTSLLGISLVMNTQKNFLLIGRDGAENRNGERADTIIVCNVNKKEKIITLISIPRDSKVTIPCGPDGKINDKIAHALYYGNKKKSNSGETCVAKTVKNMFNLNSLPFISINFEGIRDIIDKAGGVEILSPFSFCQEGKDGKRYCFSKNTKTKVNGNAFLAFVRHRKTFLRGDFDRTLNQRVALSSLFDKLKSSSNFLKIKLGVFALTKVKTNLNLNTIIDYAKTNFSSYSIKSIMLGGSDMNTSIYYYKVDERHVATISDFLNSN